MRVQIYSRHWAEAHAKIARVTLTIKLDRNWNSFQLANRAPPLSVADSSIASSGGMTVSPLVRPITWIKNGAGPPKGRAQGA